MAQLPKTPPPPTRRGDQVDDYHGELVADPYRWLEDTYSQETTEWIASQNEVTEAWLARVASREEIRKRLGELWDYPKFGVPFARGARWFQYRNSGLQNQAVLYVMDSPQHEGDVLLDPNLLAEDGTVSVSGISVTKGGEFLAYATSEGGSDWMTWRVRDVATRADLPDVVEWSKFSLASWRDDASGFYYGAMDEPAPGAEYLEKAPPRRVMFHRLGTPQSEDELVFSCPEEPEWGPNGEVSEDGRYVLVSISHGTAPQEQLHVLDLEQPEAGWRPLVADFSCKARYVTNIKSTFYLLTDDSAERQRLVAVDLDDPGKAAWREVIGEAPFLLSGVRYANGQFVCHYLEHACSRLAVFGVEGNHRYDIELPPVSALVLQREDSGIEGGGEQRLVHFAVTSFTDAGSVVEHDLEAGETRVIWESSTSFDKERYVSEQVFVTASDGAAVPLFLTRRRDVTPAGDVPVLLYGYGGFDIAMTPDFTVGRALFMERGGLLAVAALRGGGEYGEAWHAAGARQNKQRVFDDFADCARFLVSSGWSRPERIAINGGSNGGLLVGASLLQHPELFGAAVADVGVLDMLRFHKFTIGWAWKSDFGDPDDEEQYRWVRAYSPLHNVVPGRRYPPTLLTTGDHDDRVVPGHSFKFAATLQAAQEETEPADRQPVLIRVETSAGHGHGLPTSKAIAKTTDFLAFLEGALGLSEMS